MKIARLLATALALSLGMSAAFAQATKLVWTTPATGAAPGAVFTAQPVIEAQDAGGSTDPAFNGPVTVAIKASSAIDNAALLGTKTVNAVNGVATFTNLAINIPGSFILQATAPGLAEGDSSVAVVTPLDEVYSVKLPTGVDLNTTLDSFNQIRSFAVNNNPGSPWKGTMYLPRRVVNAPVTPPALVAPAGVFFWKGTATNPAAAAGSGTLKPAGPDMLHPDGKFDLSSLTLPANVMWPIGVAADDYVYVGSLNAGVLWRFNPDGTNPVAVIPTGFGSGAFVRHMTVTGKGMGTTIWYVQGSAATAVDKWVASAVDGNGAPTAFTKTKLFDVTETVSSINQRWRLVPNSARDTVYYTHNGTPGGAGVGPGLVKYSITGVKDAAFPVWTLIGATSLDIDSQDRLLMAGYNTAQGLTAFSPRDGQNITDKKDGTLANGGGLLPQILTDNAWISNNNSNGMYVARYSDRHYFWFQNDSDHFGGGATGSYQGVINTNMPAPAPGGVTVANPGTGNSLSVSFTLPNDPEVTGVNVYYSTTAGQLGTKANTAAVTASPYEVTGLTTGTQYYITVRATATDPFTGAAYDSVNVDQYTGTPALILPPVAPADITATDTKKGGEVLVSWTTPALYTDNIRIYRSTAAGTLGDVVHTVAAPAAGQPASWLDTGLANGTAVYYTVKAVNGKNEESPNTAQVSATPTDQTAPTFAGIATVKDWGYPGVRITWAGAQDNSPVTYKIYTSPIYGSFSLGSPVATVTGDTKYDLRGLTLGQTTYILVKAVDASGNADTNNKIVDATPNRVIVDPDQNAPANSDLVNIHPDAAVPALVPSAIGSSKGNADDLFPTNFAPNTYFYNTNDKLGKVLYTVPINAAGTYDISADWLNSAEVQAPHIRFSITKPDGTVMPDVFLDETGGVNGSVWNLITTTNLTPGTMTVLMDATTSTDTDPAHIFAAPAIRAIMPVSFTIYKASTAPNIDGNITPAEWQGAQDIYLGKPSQSQISGWWKGPQDYSSHVYLKWDSTALYVGEVATDDVFQLPSQDPTTYFENDSLELYIGLDPAADPARTAYAIPGDYQIILSAIDNGNNTITGVIYSPQTNFDTLTTLVEMKKTATGYTLEAKIPWDQFLGAPVPPTQGQVLGFNLHGNDNDHPVAQQDAAFSLSTLGGSYSNPQAWVRATLAGTPVLVKGDVNGDGVFNAADVQAAMRIAGGLSTVTALQLSAGDVAGGDGKITATDVLRLQRALNGKDSL